MYIVTETPQILSNSSLPFRFLSWCLLSQNPFLRIFSSKGLQCNDSQVTHDYFPCDNWAAKLNAANLKFLCNLPVSPFSIPFNKLNFLFSSHWCYILPCGHCSPITLFFGFFSLGTILVSSPDFYIIFLLSSVTLLPTLSCNFVITIHALGSKFILEVSFYSFILTNCLLPSHLSQGNFHSGWNIFPAHICIIQLFWCFFTCLFFTTQSSPPTQKCTSVTNSLSLKKVNLAADS